jgi:hypothetical protein
MTPDPKNPKTREDFELLLHGRYVIELTRAQYRDLLSVVDMARLNNIRPAVKVLKSLEKNLRIEQREDAEES